MSDDGADLGYTPNQALTGVMGGDQPKPAERMTPQQIADYLDSAPPFEGFKYVAGGDGYNDSARMCGKVMLDYLRAHPEAHDAPADDEGEFDYDPITKFPIPDTYRLVRKGLYTLAGEADPEVKEKLSTLGLTGFQVGWAVNAARTALGLGPVANPAIIVVGSKGDME